MKIIATHLLNDFSGSPKVLKQLIKGWIKNDLEIDLHTCKGHEGFLSDIVGLNYYYFNYKWAANPVIRFVNLVLSQIALCINILKTAEKEDIIYINTVLPFGAALAGKLKGNRIIYHVHETSMKPAILKYFLFGMVKWCATDVIYVSNYLAKKEPISNATLHILHNAIEDEFLAKANKSPTNNQGLRNILMICSLKEYKGVNEFMLLAKKLPNHSFKLVLNARQSDIAQFFKNTKIPMNVESYETQSNVHPFYKWADLVVNLSQPDAWIETFGLTILEGMAYGNPAIVPPVGGVTEIVTEGLNGYQISSKNIAEIAFKIAVWSDANTYFQTFQDEAKKAVKKFNEHAFISKSIQILTNDKI
ncbi:MAG: glycosyltransferase involved in cell wall biosynthesis [Flavobacteriales bacterium]|jgi:glycosyltransferase involved in cell wall biosynthesis